MNEEQIENEIQAKNLTAPRIKHDHISEQIAKADYHQFHGTTVTVCCLTLRNGFNVIGESACADPANFDEEIGKNIAFQNAREKIWSLEGYLLRERLHEQEIANA